jgi:hypothetical protein
MIDTYTFPESLVRAIFATIGTLPAEHVTPAGSTVRKLLGALEAECVAQDQARAAQLAESNRRAQLDALREELAQASAQDHPAGKKARP